MPTKIDTAREEMLDAASDALDKKTAEEAAKNARKMKDAVDPETAAEAKSFGEKLAGAMGIAKNKVKSFMEFTRLDKVWAGIKNGGGLLLAKTAGARSFIGSNPISVLLVACLSGLGQSAIKWVLRTFNIVIQKSEGVVSKVLRKFGRPGRWLADKLDKAFAWGDRIYSKYVYGSVVKAFTWLNQPNKYIAVGKSVVLSGSFYLLATATGLFPPLAFVFGIASVCYAAGAVYKLLGFLPAKVTVEAEPVDITETVVVEEIIVEVKAEAPKPGPRRTAKAAATEAATVDATETKVDESVAASS